MNKYIAFTIPFMALMASCAGPAKLPDPTLRPPPKPPVELTQPLEELEKIERR